MSNDFNRRVDHFRNSGVPLNKARRMVEHGLRQPFIPLTPITLGYRTTSGEPVETTWDNLGNILALGSAGSGKTVFLQHLTRQVLAAHPGAQVIVWTPGIFVDFSSGSSGAKLEAIAQHHGVEVSTYDLTGTGRLYDPLDFVDGGSELMSDRAAGTTQLNLGRYAGWEHMNVQLQLFPSDADSGWIRDVHAALARRDRSVPTLLILDAPTVDQQYCNTFGGIDADGTSEPLDPRFHQQFQESLAELLETAPGSNLRIAMADEIALVGHDNSPFISESLWDHTYAVGSTDWSDRAADVLGLTPLQLPPGTLTRTRSADEQFTVPAPTSATEPNNRSAAAKVVLDHLAPIPRDIAWDGTLDPDPLIFRLGVTLDGKSTLVLYDFGTAAHCLITGPAGAGKSQLAALIQEQASAKSMPWDAALAWDSHIIDTHGYVSDYGDLRDISRAGRRFIRTPNELHDLKTELDNRIKWLHSVDDQAPNHHHLSDRTKADAGFRLCLVILDDYVDLAAEYPELVGTYEYLLRCGRAVGMHLVTITQTVLRSHEELLSNSVGRIMMGYNAAYQEYSMFGDATLPQMNTTEWNPRIEQVAPIAGRGRCHFSLSDEATPFQAYLQQQFQ